MATGFGRTGTLFACEQEEVVPDFLCIAKGLSGGYLPLAATLTTDAVYESFLGPFESKRTFFHGHSYTGNPLACAAALASLRLFDEDRTLQHVRAMSERLAEGLKPLSELRHVALRCHDMGLSRRFYERLGLRFIDYRPARNALDLSDGTLNMTLIQHDGSERPALEEGQEYVHFGFIVEDAQATFLQLHQERGERTAGGDGHGRAHGVDNRRHVQRPDRAACEGHDRRSHGEDLGQKDHSLRAPPVGDHAGRRDHY